MVLVLLVIVLLEVEVAQACVNRCIRWSRRCWSSSVDFVEVDEANAAAAIVLRVALFFFFLFFLALLLLLFELSVESLVGLSTVAVEGVVG